jgi:pyruvate ferredoxin oxidoreductase gamma subunit
VSGHNGRRPPSFSRPFGTRVHGRGGQGVVTTAELLAGAAFLDGMQSQAFPMFGSERTGAPVMAFCRIAAAPITTRDPVLDPDAVIVADATLLHHVDLFSGLRHPGFVVVNTTRTVSDLGLDSLLPSVDQERVLCLDATGIGRRHLGRPLPNAALLGAFAALTDAITLDSLRSAIQGRFGGATATANERAAIEAFIALRDGADA